MNKILILQLSIGKSGYDYNIPIAPDLFDTYLVPTVKRYVEKYNYDYVRVTDYPRDIDFSFFNIDPSRPNKWTTLVRYLSLNKFEYDKIVILDNDIYIPEHAECLPEITGHMAVKDLGKERFYKEIYSKKMQLPHDTFVNAGVQMMDRETAFSLCDYITNICEKKIPPLYGYHSDQGYMNKFRSENSEKSHLLDFKWNYMSPVQKDFNIGENNFIHYCGIGRKNLLNDLRDGKIK